MTFDAAFVHERLCRCVSSPGCPLLLSVFRDGNLEQVAPDLDGQGIAWGMCQGTLSLAFFASLV